MKCLHCGSARLRTSKLRASDFPRLLRFQYPVRCCVCYTREHVGMPSAFDIFRAQIIRRRERRLRESGGESSAAKKK